jgi:Ca2+-binding EF-hand superfamily protein
MGNKTSGATFPTYDVARTHLNPKETLQLKETFKKLCRGQVSNHLTLSNFLLSLNSPSSYVRKHILPKLFSVMDIKKDGYIDFEEYTCVVVLIRIGSMEEKYKR